MAKAGFYYWPREAATRRESADDTSLCFQCGLALDGWEPADDPRHEHAKRRPECPFIKNGFGIHPFSFNFVLASRPDETAVRHISAASSKGRKSSIAPPSDPSLPKGPLGEEAGKKFELPQMPPVVAKRIVTAPRASRRSSVMKAAPVAGPLAGSPARTGTAVALPSTVPSLPPLPVGRRSTLRGGGGARARQTLLRGVEHLFTAPDLEVPLHDLLGQLVERKLSEFDRNAEQLCQRFDSESRRILG